MGLIFDKRGSYDRKHVPRAHQPALEFRRLGVLREAGSPPPVTGLLVRGRVWVALPRTSLHSARYLPSRACSLLAAYRAARSPSPARGRRPLATSRACSFPLAAVPLSRLASAVSIARNVQSTSRFLIVGPTQNAEAPAVGCGGRFGRKLSGESCLLVARLRWGRVQSACGGCSPSEWNRRARCGRFNLCGDAVARTDCLAPDSLTG